MLASSRKSITLIRRHYHQVARGKSMMDDGKTRCCVLGGCGFLGRHLAEGLLRRQFNVSVFDIRKTFDNDNITFHTGDLCNKEDLVQAFKNVNIVFHCATPSPLSNDRVVFYKVNYHGTQTVIKACKEAGVARLVLTSSASVVFNADDIKNGDEALPYASKPLDYYTLTKALQEQAVLEANCAQLHTIAVRPHGIFGPRDPHMLPTAVRTAKAGKMKFTIGDGSNVVDFTHVSNVVHGHILAALALKDGATCCGKAYNITNDEPVKFWEFLSRMLTGLGYDAPQRHLPYKLIFYLAFVLQFICAILKPVVEIKPTFTPFTVAIAGTHHYYSCERAKKDIGYRPIIGLDKAIEETLVCFPELRKGGKHNKRA